MQNDVKEKHSKSQEIVLNNSSSKEKMLNPMETKPSSTNILIRNNVPETTLIVKQKKHVWTPSGYESPALALRKPSKMDRIKDQLQGWRVKASKGEKLLMKIEDVDRIFNIWVLLFYDIWNIKTHNKGIIGHSAVYQNNQYYSLMKCNHYCLLDCSQYSLKYLFVKFVFCCLTDSPTFDVLWKLNQPGTVNILSINF